MNKIYSGTTTKNYLDASIIENGELHYVKSRLKSTGIRFPDALFYVNNLEEATIHAISSALELNGEHKPLIIYGETDKWPYISGNEPFKVEKVWTLRNPNQSIDEISELRYTSTKDLTRAIEQYFQEKSPIELFKTLQNNLR